MEVLSANPAATGGARPRSEPPPPNTAGYAWSSICATPFATAAESLRHIVDDTSARGSPDRIACLRITFRANFWASGPQAPVDSAQKGMKFHPTAEHPAADEDRLARSRAVANAPGASSAKEADSRRGCTTDTSTAVGGVAGVSDEDVRWAGLGTGQRNFSSNYDSGQL